MKHISIVVMRQGGMSGGEREECPGRDEGVREEYPGYRRIFGGEREANPEIRKRNARG